MQPQDRKRVQELIGLYQSHIVSNRCHVKPHFQDFDITKTGYVTKNQFLRILAQFGLYPSQRDTNLLLKHYMDKGNLHEVNYYDFCRDIEAAINYDGVIHSKTYAELFKDPRNQRERLKPNAYILNTRPTDLTQLIRRLQKIVNEERIRISEFLRDFDKLRSGTITVKQLRLGFNMAKIQLSNHEFELLIDNFHCPDKQGYVFWNKICDMIDEVHTVKGLERDPGYEKKIIDVVPHYIAKMTQR